MVDSGIAGRVADALEIDADVFQARVESDAEVIKSELNKGTFDNAQGIVGLEYEFYAVDEQSCALHRVPRRLLDLIGFEKELGLHNAEMNTSPQPLNAAGLLAQEAEVNARLSAALDRTRSEQMRLVSDAMWTIPPTGETAKDYLTDSVDIDGVRVATNMSDAVRYHAMANSARPAGRIIEAPHVSLRSDTIMPESLITSIQPHYQVPQAVDLPTFFRYAIRIAGPLLALGVNSPFFPPDLYDDGVEAEEVIEDAWMEHRISVFETVMNTDQMAKVRFPNDIESPEDAVDLVVNDDTFVPMPVERGNRFDDQFAYFRMKHGTYWRWVRPVFEGATETSAHARIEFRPISGQPTVRDSIAFQAVYAGLLEAMFRDEHGAYEIDWTDARNNFYDAMREGIGAELQWITADGDPTTDTSLIYEDIFEIAADGLKARGIDAEMIEEYLEPLRCRVQEGVTPAGWKHEKVERSVRDGSSLDEAITSMQREYLGLQRETLLEQSFADWIGS